MNITEQHTHIMDAAAVVAKKISEEDALQLGMSLDAMFTQLTQFNQVRRRFRRLRDLAARRPVAQNLLEDVSAKIPAGSDNLLAAVDILRRNAPIVQCMVGEELDLWLNMIWSHDSPIKPRLYSMLSLFGFSEGEVSWAHREMAVNLFAVSGLAAQRQENLLILLLDAVNDGRKNFELAGFVTLTGDTDKDAHVQCMLSAAQHKGVTLSVYFVMILQVACALACRVAGRDKGESLWGSYF